MKSNKKFTKAAAVVVLVGIGLFYNSNKKVIFQDPFHPFANYYNIDSTDSEDTNTTDNKLFIFAVTIIKTGIHQLISNI